MRLDGFDDSVMALVLVGSASGLDRSSSVDDLLRSGLDRGFDGNFTSAFGRSRLVVSFLESGVVRGRGRLSEDGADETEKRECDASEEHGMKR